MKTRIFEGRFNIHMDKGTKMISLKDTPEGQYSATDAELVANKVAEASKKHKVDFNRWSFYIKGVNQEIPKEEKRLKAAEVHKAMKAGYKPVITAAKWGKPRLDLVNPEAPSTNKQDDNIVLL